MLCRRMPHKRPRGGVVDPHTQRPSGRLSLFRARRAPRRTGGAMVRPGDELYELSRSVGRFRG